MTITGKIFIDNMRLHACHGVLEQERITGNDYVITLRVEYPVADSLQSDDVNDTLNYAHLADIIRQEMAVRSNLVEHVAGRIVGKVSLSYPEVTYIYIKVRKVAPPMHADCDGSGIELEWKK